ncbi:hypothetical protein ABT124_16780 [Streptomyces sp. NPDC001982]|uniref:hypothetical protein n=1 Tax=unclassified Streptomyces TaxID=2593676 RepID=UPI00332EF577
MAVLDPADADLDAPPAPSGSSSPGPAALVAEDQLRRDPGVDTADDHCERVLDGGQLAAQPPALVRVPGATGGVPAVACQEFGERGARGARGTGRETGRCAATGVRGAAVSAPAAVTVRKILRFEAMTLPQE